MINFRFHLVSLVAVFLALAVGVVMGYGILGQPTVSGLQNRIDTVEANAEAKRAENEQLAARVTPVDDLEWTEGSVAAVLGLSDLGRDVVGHYGFGNGAERLLPEWSQP